MYSHVRGSFRLGSALERSCSQAWGGHCPLVFLQRRVNSELASTRHSELCNSQIRGEARRVPSCLRVVRWGADVTLGLLRDWLPEAAAVTGKQCDATRWVVSRPLSAV